MYHWMYYPFWGGANFQFFLALSWASSYLAPENELLGLFIPKLLKIGAMVTFLRVFSAELSTMKNKQNQKPPFRRALLRCLFRKRSLCPAKFVGHTQTWGFCDNFCSRTLIAHRKKKHAKWHQTQLFKVKKTTPSSTPTKKHTYTPED